MGDVNTTRLIRQMASQMRRHELFDDLVQEGEMALVRAQKTWTAEGGAALWTYARKFVFGAMLRYAVRESREASKAGEHSPDAENRYGRGVSDSGPHLRLHESDAGILTGARTLATDPEEAAPSPEEIAAERELWVIVEGLLPGLSVKERTVLRLMFVDELDVRTLADRLGLPKTTAHDAMTSLIGKLRGRARDASCPAYGC